MTLVSHKLFHPNTLDWLSIRIALGARLNTARIVLAPVVWGHRLWRPSNVRSGRTAFEVTLKEQPPFRKFVFSATTELKQVASSAGRKAVSCRCSASNDTRYEMFDYYGISSRTVSAFFVEVTHGLFPFFMGQSRWKAKFPSLGDCSGNGCMHLLGKHPLMLHLERAVAREVL